MTAKLLFRGTSVVRNLSVFNSAFNIVFLGLPLANALAMTHTGVIQTNAVRKNLSFVIQKGFALKDLIAVIQRYVSTEESRFLLIKT
jgi:hypothetical protein